MSVPAELMGGQQPGAAPPGAEPSPGAAPTMTPQQPKGEQASADSKVEIARRLIEESMVAHGQGEGAKGPKYKALLKALNALVTGFGKSEDAAQAIMPAEIKSALMGPAGEPGQAKPAAAPPGGGAPAMAA